MAAYPPPPPGYDPRAHRRFLRDQARAQAYAQRAALRAQRQQARLQARSLRRSSILGPIVLIAAGIVFLLIQTGRLDYQKAGDWYAQWWPFLLIAAGLIVLAEWSLDQYLLRDPQRPPYRRSLGGGILLLLLFVLVGAGIIGHGSHSFGIYQWFPGANPNHFSLDQLIGDRHESDQTLNFPVTAGSSLFIVNPSGNVSVSGTSADGRIHIALHKLIYATSDAEAESRAATFIPTTSNVGPSFNLTMPSLQGATGHLVITVPPATATTVSATHGDVLIESLNNAVSVNANQGGVALSAITGITLVRMNSTRASFAAHNMGGSITVQGRANDLTLTDIAGPVNLDGQFFGPTHLEHLANSARFHTSRTELQLARLDGQVDINNAGITADQLQGPVILRTSYRSLSLDRVSGDVTLTNRNGTVDLLAGPALGNITLENRNGSVTLTLPQKAVFAVNAQTTDGDVHADFPLTTSTTGHAKVLAGSVGTGGPLLHLSTSNGDIAIRKQGAQPSTRPTISVLPPDGVYQILNVNSGMALETPSMSSAYSLHTEQAPANGSRSQLWTLTNIGGDAFTLKNGYSSQMLDVGGASRDSGALVNQFPSNGDANQKWRVIPVGNGQYELVSENSGMALDVKGASKNAHARIQQFAYHGGANQKWTFIPKR